MASSSDQNTVDVSYAAVAATPPVTCGTNDDLPASDVESTAASPPLVQPVASRLISCLRAPCLKRNLSHSPSSPISSASGSMSPDCASATSSTDEAIASAGSFAAIKRVMGAKPCSRHVHFDAKPPEAGITHSRDNYDRRPIECTRGGSAGDLSLPPRSTCLMYLQDADDEEDVNSEAHHAEQLRGYARWSRLKNAMPSPKGGLVQSHVATNSNGESDRSTSLDRSDSGDGPAFGVDAAATKDEISVDEDVIESSPSADMAEDDDNSCSVPFHGVRSFGRIAHRPDESFTPVSKARVETFSKPLSNVGGDTADDDDPEHEAFRQAVYAALSLSPNATPMPSPSVRPRWECVTSYFETDSSSVDEVRSGKSSGASTPGVASKESDRNTKLNTSQAEEPSELSVKTSTMAQVDALQPFRASHSMTLLLSPSKDTPSPSVESSTVPSSSPMSSRCSSSDTGSSDSQSDSGKVDYFGRNAFESAFEARIQSPPDSSSASEPRKCRESATTSPTRFDGSTDESSAPELGSCASSSSNSGTSAGGWLSSCCTSPDLDASDSPKCNSDVSITPTRTGSITDAASILSSDSGSAKSAMQGLEGASAPILCRSDGFLSASPRVPKGSVSAPVTAMHSPCVLSADEHEDDDRVASTSTVGATERSSRSAPRMRRSASGNTTVRKSKKCARRTASDMDPHPRRSYSGSAMGQEDGERLASEHSPLGEEEHRDSKTARQPRSSEPRLRPPLSSSSSSSRSKSMSSAIPAPIKRSSFASSSFRSELDDEGALGGF